MQDLYLVCGVSGSGKTWVCNQLKDKFEYIPNDDYIKTGNYAPTLASAVLDSSKPVLADNPFGERLLCERLKELGVEKIIPVFIVEDPSVISLRFYERNGRRPDKSVITRASTILDRAKEWKSFYGTSKEVLEHLKSV